MITINHELLKEIIQTVRARKANIKNYKALCEASDVIANTDPAQIDWDHSYIGWYKGKIAWAYVFNIEHTMPLAFVNGAGTLTGGHLARNQEW